MQRFALITALIFGLTFSAVAQTANDNQTNVQTKKMTLNEAIDIALENNYSLKQAENNMNLAEMQVKSSKADFLPSINMSGNGFKQIGRQFNENTVQYGNFTINGVSASMSGSVTLFNGFQNINNLRSSQFNADSRQDQLQRARETVIFQTASRYLQVLLDQQLLQISQENLDASQKQLEQVKAQVDVGARPAADQYNQESQVASNELEVTNRENQLQYDKLRLVRMLQIDPMTDVELVEPDISEEDIMPRDYNLQQLVQTALSNRSDLRSDKANIESARYQLKATEGSLYPSLSFNSRLSSNYNDQNRERFVNPQTGQPVFRTISFSDQFFDQNINRSLSLSLNIPIFDNLNRRTQVQSQEINYKNAQLSLEDTKLQIVQEVRQAYNDYTSLLKQLESTEKALKASKRAYETQQERYKVGGSTLIEVSQANADYVKAQSDRARALYNFMFQEKLLNYYLGRLDSNISFKQSEGVNVDQ